MKKEQRAMNKGNATIKRAGFLLLFSLLTFNFSLAFAYRELEYRNVIEGKTVPAMAVSGEMMLFIVGRVINER